MTSRFACGAGSSLVGLALVSLSLGLSAGFLCAPLGAQSSSRGTARIDAKGSNLFEVLSQTFDRVALTGERNWYSLVPKGGNSNGMRLLRYRESIAIRPKKDVKSGPLARKADFRLTLLEPGEIGATMSTTEKNLRKAAFRDRSGFLHYQRDFRIQDAAQASKNYKVLPMGAWINRRASGGPRIVRVFDLFPKGEHAQSPGASIYRVTVDLEHQIVLDWIRFSAKGQLISALSYEKLALGAHASFDAKTQWWKPWIDVKSYAGTKEAGAKLGFAIAQPAVLPQGFRLLEVRTAKEPILGTRYSVLIYTDGLRNFFLLQHRSNQLSAVHTKPSKGPSDLVTVKRFRMGPVTQYDADYKGMSYLLLGHEEEGDEVPTLLQSLVR